LDNVLRAGTVKGVAQNGICILGRTDLFSVFIITMRVRDFDE